MFHYMVHSTILKKIDANDCSFGTNSEQAFCSVDCVLRCLTVLVDSFSGTMRMTFTNKRELFNLNFRPQIRCDYPLNLSILLGGGKETNKDSLSNGE